MYSRILSGYDKHKWMHATSRVRDVAIPRQQATPIASVGNGIVAFGALLFGPTKTRSVASRREREDLEDAHEDCAVLEAEEMKKSDEHTVRSWVLRSLFGDDILLEN